MPRADLGPTTGWDEVRRLEAQTGWRMADRFGPDGRPTRPAGPARAGETGDEEVFSDEVLRAMGEVDERGAFPVARLDELVSRIVAAGPVGFWDVGAGNGALARAAQARGVPVVAVEPGRSGAAAATDRGVLCLQGTLAELGLPDACLPGVGLFDVLEHLADPHALLDEVARVLAPGAPLLVTVPAGPRLWSQMDEFAGHRWRATRRSLRDLLAPHGLEQRSLAHWGVAGVPAVLASQTVPYRLGVRRTESEAFARVLELLRAERPAVRRALRASLAAEGWARRRVPVPVGISLVAEYRKPAQQAQAGSAWSWQR